MADRKAAQTIAAANGVAEDAAFGALIAPCLVAERCWDRVRWAIEEYAWRFDGLRRPHSSRRAR